MTAIRVLLADDEPLVRSGLRAILESEPDVNAIRTVHEGESLLFPAAVLGGTATAGPHDGRWVLSVTLPVRDVWP